MGIVAVVGDATTTTSIAIAAAWPRDDPVLVLEFDPGGGSLAAWVDVPPTPSLSSFVAGRSASRNRDEPADWRDVEAIVRSSPTGVRFIAAPTRTREAARSIEEAGGSLLAALASAPATALADLGRSRPADRLPAALTAAQQVVVIHRQDPASSGAAAVRLDRLVEAMEQLNTLAAPVHLAVIGDDPFDIDEIAAYLTAHASVTVESATPIAADPLSAMVFAGRTGVSAKRLGRLPLLRSITPLADRLAAGTSRATTPDIAEVTA